MKREIWEENPWLTSYKACQNYIRQALFLLFINVWITTFTILVRLSIPNKIINFLNKIQNRFIVTKV